MDVNPRPFRESYYRPAIPVILSLMAGVLVGAYIPGLATTAILVLLAAAIQLVGRMRKHQPACWSPLLASLAAGYLAMAPWISPIRGPSHITRFLDGEHWQVQATVEDRPLVRFGRIQFIATVDTLSRNGVGHAVKGRIRVTVVGEAALAAGDRVTFPARLRSFRNFRNPGGFDYRRAMAFQRIHGSAWVQAQRLHIEDGRSSTAAGRLVHAIRARIGRAIDAAGGDAATEARAVLKALVHGDRSGIDEGLRERFNRSGVGHLLAISGLHVGIVATLGFGLFRWIGSFFPALLWRGWVRPIAAAAAMAPVLAYGLLAGMSSSTQRAVIMVGVCLAALILGRSHDTRNTIAVAALAILVVFPPALFSISFQLSFAAVLAIVVGLETLRLSRIPAQPPAWRIARWLLNAMLVSALAILGTLPVVLFHFNQTSLVGMAANLVLIPLVGFVAVPLGLVCAVLLWCCEPVATLGFWLAIQVLRLALAVMDGFAALPFASLTTITPSLLEIVLYYLAGWSLLNLRKTAIAPWALAAALVLMAVDGFYWTHQRFWHRDLKVTAIDVGQGASTLMELPGGGIVLVDGGGFADNRLFDPGQRVVAPVLWRKKIARVDRLILSHPNADHLNGLIFIARNFDVGELWTNGDAPATQSFGELMAVCREKQVAVRRMDTDAGDIAAGGVTFSILHPPPGFIGRSEPVTQDIRNDTSLVVKATYGQTAFLFTGDITSGAETGLVQRSGGALASTVLFAPHHGSRTSSSAGLIAAVKPQIVVISAGAGNRFHFPHDAVLDRFRDAGCRILCTCDLGAVALSSDGRAVRY